MYNLFIYRVDDSFIIFLFKVHNVSFYSNHTKVCQKEERVLLLETGTRVLSYSSPLWVGFCLSVSIFITRGNKTPHLSTSLVICGFQVLTSSLGWGRGPGAGYRGVFRPVTERFIRHKRKDIIEGGTGLSTMERGIDPGSVWFSGHNLVPKT